MNTKKLTAGQQRSRDVAASVTKEKLLSGEIIQITMKLEPETANKLKKIKTDYGETWNDLIVRLLNANEQITKE